MVRIYSILLSLFLLTASIGLFTGSVSASDSDELNYDEELEHTRDYNFSMNFDYVSSSGKTLDLKYDIVDEEWSGEDTGSYSTGYEWSDGICDGGDDGLPELDGKIKYTIYTDSEISKSEQNNLADHPEDYNYLNWFGDQDSGGDDYNIYSHVFTATDNKIVIQYWFFYLYNDHIFDHEGDWEMIQIILDKDENPQKAGYSQHYGGDKRSWSNVNKIDGTHPEVYVAEGGHASYFESGIRDVMRFDRTVL